MTDDSAGKCPFGFGAEGTAQEGSATRHMSMATGLRRDELPELVREEIAPGADGLPTGRCLCGRVSFQIKRPVSMVFANHDAISRRRSGGVAMTVMVRATNTAFNGWGQIVHFPISERETSCFCRACGTPIFLRHLQPEAMDGMISISAGALDSTEGLRLAADLCHDEKPTFYAFEGERRAIPAAEIALMFAPRAE
jgi:hypothetical protein